jgi:hypothetical protein
MFLRRMHRLALAHYSRHWWTQLDTKLIQIAIWLQSPVMMNLIASTEKMPTTVLGLMYPGRCFFGMILKYTCNDYYAWLQWNNDQSVTVMLERENANTSVQFTNYLLIDTLSQACSISNKRSTGNDSELYRDNKGCHLPMPVSAIASINKS